MIAFGKSLYSNYISKYHLVSNDLNLEFYYFDNNLNSNSIKLLKKNLIDTSLILDESKKEGLKKLLYSACKSNKLSKNTEIVYNRENSMIETIKVLKYENGKYTLKTTETKKSKCERTFSSASAGSTVP